ncbi:hypothetical protein D3C80_1259220 [compost metagenome]
MLIGVHDQHRLCIAPHTKRSGACRQPCKVTSDIQLLQIIRHNGEAFSGNKMGKKRIAFPQLKADSVCTGNLYSLHTINQPVLPVPLPDPIEGVLHILSLTVFAVMKQYAFAQIKGPVTERPIMLPVMSQPGLQLFAERIISCQSVEQLAD